MDQPTILVYGRDLALLRTRGMVLMFGGYKAVTTADFRELKKILLARPIDLVILCHSLSDDQCDEVSAEFETRQGLKTLVLTIEPFDCRTTISGEVLDVVEGPAKLLSIVKRLLCREFSEKLPANVLLSAILSPSSRFENHPMFRLRERVRYDLGVFRN